MDLVKITNKLPLKAYPEDKLNELILTQFTVWVANLLSLTDEASANKLEMALPAIKTHCWSLGFDEIKKMFEMYADSKLSIKPLPNYFDRILLGKIVDAYKEQKVVIKKVVVSEITETEKQKLIASGLKKCFDNYEENKDILDGYLFFMYDIFYEDGYLPTDKASKLKAFEDAKLFLSMQTNVKSNSLNDHYKIKEIKRELIKDRSAMVINKAKEMVVLKFLRLTYRDENKVKELKLKYLNC